MIPTPPESFVNGPEENQRKTAPANPPKSDARNQLTPPEPPAKARVEHPLHILVSLLETQIQRVDNEDITNMTVEILGPEGGISAVGQVSISPRGNLLVEVTRGVDIGIDLTSPEWKSLELLGWQKPTATFPLSHRFFKRKIDPTTVALHLANSLRQALKVSSDSFYRFS